MAKTRLKAYKDLPTGLHYKPSRDCYIFIRIDGSSQSLGKDKAKAKRKAIIYNRTFRVDPSLSHEILSSSNGGKELDKGRNREILKHFLPEILVKIGIDKDWSDGSKKNMNQMFSHLLNYFGEMRGNDITIEHVTTFIESVNSGGSANIYNRYLNLVTTCFSYCIRKSLMSQNPAKQLDRITICSKDEADIHRLTLEDFRKIHKLAGDNGIKWMQVAMELSLQTSHSVHEIATLKYQQFKEDSIFIERKKVRKNPSSRVQIPINLEFMKIIALSKSDSVDSPFIVHRIRAKRYRNRELGKGIEHETQIASVTVSRTFSDLRDKLGLYAQLPKASRPSFHDIRSLSISWQEGNGFDAQKRAAHADKKTTALYERGHGKYIKVNDVIIPWEETDT